ncbi:MAG: Holliday junction resolvase RuvX [Bacteroidetes bacterium]|nr:Holliday junction resolvase RuvX [Bacteroidota bacterium]
MARLLAIDYGTKRCGIAVSDPMQLIATGLTTVHSKDILAWLAGYLNRETVETFVVGEPKRLNGQPTDATQHVEAFVKHLRKQFPLIPVQRIDERFTSKMAFQSLIDSGLGRKDRQNKALIDEVSAVILLQNYMDSRM